MSTPTGAEISRQLLEIAAKRQRATALEAEARRLVHQANEQERLLELSRLELPERSHG